MRRNLTALAVALVLCATALAQPTVVRSGRGAGLPQGVISARASGQPQGVATAPIIPSPWNLSAGNPMPQRHLPLARPFIGGGIPYYGGYYGPYAYSPYWPTWYDTDPVPVVTQQVPVPVYPAPTATTAIVPTQPEELRANLSLTVPLRARVWMGGQEVDANASPLILESPVLRDGQSYTFDIKVTWPAGDKTEERTRAVTIAAGDQKSLTYQK